MSEPAGNHTGAPRFPWVAALLCAACVGVAVWTWMRYSYAWDVTARWAAERELMQEPETHSGPYLRVRSNIVECNRTSWPFFEDCVTASVLFSDGVGDVVQLYVVLPKDARLAEGEKFVLTGRTFWSIPALFAQEAFMFDATASRFTWQSITGLAVGAMGVVVFAVYLRHWLKERRAVHEEE